MVDWAFSSENLVPATEPIYHYTDSGGALGIISHSVLWASQASGLNDHSEVRYGWDQIGLWLEAQDKLPEDLALLLARLVAENGTSEPGEIFVASASTIRDDAGQWRLYGGAGSGYVIELDPAVHLGILGKEAPSTRAGLRFSWNAVMDITQYRHWAHVMYEEAQWRAVLFELAKWAQDLAEALERTEDPQSEVWDDYQGAVAQALESVAVLIKHPAYAAECEVRCVASLLWGERHMHFRSSRYGLVPYLQLTQDEARHAEGSVVDPTTAAPVLPIRSIGIGPMIRPENAQKAAEALLRAAEYKSVNVWASQVPLR